MLLALFQFLDFLVIIALVLGHYDVSPWRLLLFAAAYLIIKGIAYRGSWMSWFDVIIGAYLFYLMFGASGFFTWIAVVWMAYKLITQFAYST